MALPTISHVFRLSRDPELTYTNGGLAICKVGLVASEKRQDKETTLWLNATAFGKTAEFLHNVRKGQRVFVTKGRLSTDEWTDNSGQRKSRTTMIIDGFEYIESRNDAQAAPQASYAPPQTTVVEHQDANGNVTATQSVPSASAPQGGQTAVDVNEDEIPFAPIGLAEGGFYIQCI
jgi:single-strand DNA-binding protein